MIFILLLKSVWIVGGFNISPKPNYLFEHPKLKTFLQPTRSSQFGFSINLRSSGVMVGAPRAQSDLEYQRNIQETGAIYKCSFAAPSTCVPYRLDEQGNTNYEDFYNETKLIRSENKEFQMLGATMDGLGSDDAWFVACAPKRKGTDPGKSYLHGTCFLTEGVEATKPPNSLYQMKPLREKAKQRWKQHTYYYWYAQQGLSSHVTDDGDEVLVGAPGIMLWCGSVIRYRQISRSRRARQNVYWESTGKGDFLHECVVPNPLNINLAPHSYFGYAVSSGRFLGTAKVLYVASAPQANKQLGEVIIFDYIDSIISKEMRITRKVSFNGWQMGEYFGYSLLTEDFNSDGLPDLAIGAPMHSLTGDYDNGAVYVMMNRGNMRFEMKIKLSSSYELGGRFGTSLGKIGDIDRDGYNDIAIGTPFEGDGAVYIFHGSSDGLQSRPSQKLIPQADRSRNPSKQPSMFGYALSRGVDIDGNRYSDLAVGAPNEEAVYVFRTYPIVGVEVKINSTKRELPAEGGTFELEICWTTEYRTEKAIEILLEYSLDVDEKKERARITNRQNPDMKLENVTIGRDPVCRLMEVAVQPSPTTLNDPVVIELHFDLAQSVTPRDDASFCETCVILDPQIYKQVQERIPFKTGCRTETCFSDLRITNLRWTDIASPYVVGTTKRATFLVEVENMGENAYQPQLNFTIPVTIRLETVPSGCQQSPPVDGHVGVLCDLNDRFPLKSSSRFKHSLIFDMTQLQAAHMQVKVRVEALTTSKEQTHVDNEMEINLDLLEFSHIDILSKSTPPEARFGPKSGMLDVTHLVKLHNNGPSTLNDALLLLEVPQTYTANLSTGEKSCHIVQLSNIIVKSSYNESPLKVIWVPPGNPNGFSKQTSELYSNLHVDDPSNSDAPGETATSAESDDFEDSFPDDFPSDAARYKRSSLWIQPIHPSLGLARDEWPANRTVYFNCARDRSSVECLQLQISLPPFQVGHIPITVEVEYKLDLNAIEPCLQDQEDIFVVQVPSGLRKPSDTPRETFRIARNNPHTVVYRERNVSTPIWIYVISSFGGLFLLAVISYTMHRLGFFVRHMKEELEKCQRESIMSLHSNTFGEENESHSET